MEIGDTIFGNAAALLRIRGNVSHYASMYETRSDLIIESYNLFSLIEHGDTASTREIARDHEAMLEGTRGERKIKGDRKRDGIEGFRERVARATSPCFIRRGHRKTPELPPFDRLPVFSTCSLSRGGRSLSIREARPLFPFM